MYLAALGAALLVLWASGCGDEEPSGTPLGPTGPEAVDPGTPFEGTASTITAAEIQRIVEDIAHDSTLGRVSPSPELDAVARYIANAFSAAGLTAAGTDGYFQWFAVESGGDAQAPNVVGWIEGSDPALRDEFVVLSAHFDHLGGIDPGLPVDHIYNGADDNASGTAALLEIAGAVGAMATPPRRSLVFLATSAEELGLVGAARFMGQSPFPPVDMIANLNFDMIGRGTADHVRLVRASRSVHAATALAVAAQHADLGLVLEDRPDDGFLRRSDSGVFDTFGVDALFFHSGLHEQYHTVSDEVELLNLPKIERVARLGYWVAVELGGRP